MQESRLEYLMKRYVQFACTDVEEQELMALLGDDRNREEAKLLIAKLIEQTDAEFEMPEASASILLENIFEKERSRVVDINGKTRRWPVWTKVAAAIVIPLLVGASFWFNVRSVPVIADKSKEVVQKDVKPVVPGGNHALLTLGDGKTFVLDSLRDGTIRHGNISIRKNKGMLVFSALPEAEQTEPGSYNTLSTPRGGQYQCLLPDGSKAWLNAESSIKFPTSFAADRREVEMSGEVYFEIKSLKNKPFITKVGNMFVEVLGTHFNVNAYPDENTIKTSLLEGRINVNNGNVSKMLKPGEQGVVNVASGSMKVSNADMVEVMAWKNGLFHFDQADIYTIMGQISRWYDVEVEYSGKMQPRRFAGKISRSADLAEVLQILELSNVKFKVAGRKIVVQ